MEIEDEIECSHSQSRSRSRSASYSVRIAPAHVCGYISLADALFWARRAKKDAEDSEVPAKQVLRDLRAALKEAEDARVWLLEAIDDFTGEYVICDN